LSQKKYKTKRPKYLAADPIFSLFKSVSLNVDHSVK